MRRTSWNSVVGGDAAIRVKAVCIIRRAPTVSATGDAEVLLSFAIDPDTGIRYGRFLGGGVEYGERAEDAIRRELWEEIGAAITDVEQLGTVENLFTSEQRRIHEVIFVFSAAFADEGLYRRESFSVDEAVCDGPACWVAIGRLLTGEIQVYPPELLALLSNLPADRPV
jgi:ADP-ribose pyrophosphatase YjhB (NUDIX family)